MSNMTRQNAFSQEAGERGDAEQSCFALAELCAKRANTYGLLARIYGTEVDEELLDVLRQVHFPASSGSADVDAGYRNIATFLSNTWEGSLTQLAKDYALIFIGHGIDAFSAAYPFESVYTSERRLLMQEARDEVLAIYRASGLDKSESWKESEDHISAEFEFMQIMCQRAEASLRSLDEDVALEFFETQSNFLADHLESWVPLLTADMLRFAQTDFYRGVAYLTNGFLSTEREFLDELLFEQDHA